MKDSVLFRDQTGQLCIRLLYREVHEDISHDPPYNYEPYVYREWLTPLPLQQVLDVPTFKRVPHTGNYWVDKRYVYTDPYVPKPPLRYFFVLGRRAQVHYLPNPDFVRVDGTLWYRGVPVPGNRIPKPGGHEYPSAMVPPPRQTAQNRTSRGRGGRAGAE